MTVRALFDKCRGLLQRMNARLAGADQSAGADDSWQRAPLWPALGLLVSALGVIGLALHLTGVVTFDPPALVLAFIALVPWLALFVDNASLPGGWRLEFRRLETTQRRQRSELDTIKFLLENTLSRWEREHLVKLNSSNNFPYRWQKNFEAELTRLLALDFIDRRPDHGFRSARNDRRVDNDLREHFYVTDRGKDYLARLAERSEDEDEAKRG